MSQKSFLITGGPVHAYLDNVKIITNKFKGGRIAELATRLSKNASITYLCSKDSKKPTENPNLRVIFHDGFDDYHNKVILHAQKVDAVILGAAVANLIPYTRIEGKFPSHNYKPGELVPLIFKIAPRVINDVKMANSKVHLFGFKLLSEAPYEELINAAYRNLLDSKATAVIANDESNLDNKYVVTKDRAVHPMSEEDLPDWILGMVNDIYYSTKVEPYSGTPFPTEFEEMSTFNSLKQKPSPEGYVFGTIAKRTLSGGFWTTSRGKKEATDYCFVNNVDHKNKVITCFNKKATLNAPLLDHIFKILPQVDIILHDHKISRIFPSLPYAPPGTERDSIRNIQGSFNILNHGSFSLYTKEKGLIKWPT